MEGSGSVLVVVGLFTAMPFLIAGFVVIFVLVMNTKSAPLPTDPEGDVSFYARVRPSDKLFSPTANVSSRTNGRLTVTASQLFWQPGSGEPWAVPIPAIVVGSTHNAFSLSGQGVDLAIDGSGGWRVTVSDRPINRFTRNTSKDFREADASRKLAGLLLSRGARYATPVS